MRRSVEDEVKEKTDEQRKKSLPVIQLQRQKNKSYILVQ